MSKDRSDDEEVYGPPNGDHILPDSPNLPRKASHKGLEGFEAAQRDGPELDVKQADIFPGNSEDDPDKTISNPSDNVPLI